MLCGWTWALPKSSPLNASALRSTSPGLMPHPVPSYDYAMFRALPGRVLVALKIVFTAIQITKLPKNNPGTKRLQYFVKSRCGPSAEYVTTSSDRLSSPVTCDLTTFRAFNENALGRLNSENFCTVPIREYSRLRIYIICQIDSIWNLYPPFPVSSQAHSTAVDKVDINPFALLLVKTYNSHLLYPRYPKKGIPVPALCPKPLTIFGLHSITAISRFPNAFLKCLLRHYTAPLAREPLSSVKFTLRKPPASAHC